MITLRRTVHTATPPSRVYPYLADFANAAEWDSGTVSCERVSGDGQPGTVYRNVSSFAGRQVELLYTVESSDGQVFVVVGRNATTQSRDTIVVHPDGPGSRVDYTAEFTFSGIARFLGPIMRPLLDRLGDKTAVQLAESLDRL
ncbi:MAG: SRPBCC family protein [Candidatus Phosphoribacter sp.]